MVKMKQEYPLYICLIWHMHQPYYRRLDTGEHLMPWVRLHATKDYLDMPLLVEECPGMKACFNMVPSLLEQLEDFCQSSVKERTLDLSRKPADSLSGKEKRSLIQNFFHCHHDRMIAPFPRYEELYNMRGWAQSSKEIERAIRYFSNEDIRDLQVWFNLAWIDPLLRDKNAYLSSLVNKGRGFTEEEKKRLLDIRRELIGEIIPTYRRLQEEGLIEISVSPFYHPILPLVYDTNFASRTHPDCPLPKIRFHHPEDASSQILSGCEFYREKFGHSPRGMWPSEGAVCPELIPLLSEADVRWFATDEDILALSLGRKLFSRDKHGALSPEEAQILYQPYLARYDQREAACFFRDHHLSDLIGFQYAGWQPEEAAQNLIHRLEKIHSQLNATKNPHVVSIILDGENCWEFYQDDGVPFLRSLYRQMVQNPILEPITPSGYLDKYPPQNTIERIHTGSWINHDFYIWIGHEDDRRSWEVLSQAHRDVSRRLKNSDGALSPEQIKKARKALAVAEGSDWNWWYGDDHSSGRDDQFDTLYRDHLMQAYQALNLEIPSHLHVPIIRTLPAEDFEQPRAFIRPVLDGRNTNYFEWLAAGSYEVSSGSMHRSQHPIRRLFFGFDPQNLHLRIDPNPDLSGLFQESSVTFVVAILDPCSWRIKVKTDPGKKHPCEAQWYRETDQGSWEYAFPHDKVAFDRILEISLPLSLLGLKPDMILHFQVILQSENHDMERCPSGVPIRLVVPGEDFEKTNWIV